MPTAMVNSAVIYYEESGSGPPIILSAGGLQGTLAGALSPNLRTIDSYQLLTRLV